MSPHVIAFALASVTLVACASAPPTATPAATPASTPAPIASVAPAPTQEAPAPHFRPLELANACMREVHLYYGEQPGDGKGESTKVAAGGTIPVPRGADGTLVLWVVDEQGNGLASVHVTRNMRHVRFDATCSKLSADSTP
jgi:hypothetical protein